MRGRSRQRLDLAGAAMLALLAPSLDAAAYSALVKARAQSLGSAFIGGAQVDVPDIVFPEESFSTDLPIPWRVARDVSNSFASGGASIDVLARYETTVDPGGIHLASRSFASADAPPLTGVSTTLTFYAEGTIEAQFTDTVTITLPGAPDGTPFLMTTTVQLDGNVGTPFLDPAAPEKTPGVTADAYASGYWGLSLGVPGGRPAGIPATITNQYSDGGAGLVSVHQYGVQYNQFSQYDLLSPKTVTLYGRSGVPSELNMYLNLQSGAACFAGGGGEFPTDGGTAEAGVHLAFSNTFGWGGIADVQLADGTPVGDVDLESQSGFDYRAAYVPEPAAAWQIEAALAPLLLLRLRRSGAPRARHASRVGSPPT
jgi:hypothetical protein